MRLSGGFVTLKNYQTNKKVIARIFDATGMQVYEGNYYSAQFEINTALTPGIYMLKIENGEQTGISQTKKNSSNRIVNFVKQKNES